MIARATLVEALGRLAGARTLVVGDVMLDEYVWGDVERISPEAPVPVVAVRRRSRVAGGAANAAAGIAALGGRVVLVGVIGTDPPGRALADELAASEVDARLVTASRPTTVKTRIIAHNQQVVRVDDEDRSALPPEVEREVLDLVSAEARLADAVVISDYAKGLVTERLAQEAIRIATAAGKPVIADPKGPNFMKYRGASVVTPNLGEAEQAAGLRIAGEEGLREAARRLREALGGGALLVTRGAQGMSLFTGSEPPLDVPASGRTVFDVTGAGDAVVGVLALALAGGVALDVAVHLANAAGGVVVAKVGTASVSPGELRDAVEQTHAGEPD